MKTSVIILTFAFLLVWVDLDSVSAQQKGDNRGNSSHITTAALINRPGFCPSNDLPASAIKDAKCTYDKDCIKPTKCCPRGATFDCLPAVKEKPGKCPTTAEKCEEHSKCESDSDCSEDRKCCNLCDKRCLKPVPVKKL
ncbi:WAP four-disulfide core domain protein 5 isoform X2 [Microcaecilia unicolor]|uniref:WAP four-disulfide core domain protein 5-like isoform X2 n=1 Tax=Microcaecilia unicolor TaxID=1415580 RepID=A0A6P7WZ64_9AMPH|nr:WAP four-disulfide core domain protein 5-like isoform X2 [Microcaecilia unicolor]